MPKVVSNTTPIISLMKIGKLEILKDLYEEIYIPQEVYNEIEAGKHKNYYLNLLEFKWIKIEQIQDRKSIAYFLDLDKGEAEAIILATETEADLILIDESLGRYHAKHAGLNVTGTIGILIKAKKQALISELKPLIFELREKGVWLSDSFIERILELSNEI
jgi:predicted nucleic acid-binding protein